MQQQVLRVASLSWRPQDADLKAQVLVPDPNAQARAIHKQQLDKIFLLQKKVTIWKNVPSLMSHARPSPKALALLSQTALTESSL